MAAVSAHHCERRAGVVLGYRNKQLVFPHIDQEETESSDFKKKKQYVGF